ncbi:hypothetical protein J2Z70_001555 [Paenibacillus silagei]|uniref:Transposase n=1 Tax=Paenibacillus silagei TaxID=1670801 RepID=A0ABS4NPT4_9BACL|nr:hypothetical protein [Paenibacillus silagei]
MYAKNRIHYAYERLNEPDLYRRKRRKAVYV